MDGGAVVSDSADGGAGGAKRIFVLMLVLAIHLGSVARLRIRFDYDYEHDDGVSS